ncbi:ATP-binding protein [Listeria welshimeri]|nr:ATP-binding protein [Listeria welshimeri]
MYDEILKIIEGGMTNNRQKVINYARKLSDYYEENDQVKIAKKIDKLIVENNTQLSSLDSLTSKPFDNESKLEMVDVIIPKESDETLIFSKLIENEINDFILSYGKRNELMSLGIETNNHLLLYGPPGTGKTSLARFISLQVGLPLVTARLDGLVSSMLGSTAKNIRKIFDFASKQPCVLFLDEFDVLAKIRDDKNELGELKRVVNSLLQNIDSFDDNSILIAATNHPQLLDEAVWRRFDKVIKLNLPESEQRKELIEEFSEVLATNYANETKKINQLVRLMTDYSPSTIKSIINTSAKKSIINGQSELKYSQIVYEIFIREHPSEVSEEELINYLNKNGVSQREITEVFGFPARKVRSLLKKEELNNG